MPLLDHFRPPVIRRMPWETLQSVLIGMLAVQLNRLLPAEFVALDTVRLGPA